VNAAYVDASALVKLFKAEHSPPPTRCWQSTTSD
jgi:hypothetical protein